jgi:glycosyltransferase involved in cell wall biosynthesis
MGAPRRPRVSVIIPTHNRASLVMEAVESVLSQTYRDFEVVVVDDGSTDDTADVLKPHHGHVRYVHQPHRGVSAARNVGIQFAKGEFLAFLDSDDLWVKSKLEEQMTVMQQRPSYKLVYTDEIWIHRGVRINQGKRHRKYSGWIFDKVLPLCIISFSSVLMRREVIRDVGPLDESLPVCEDYDYWIRVAARYPVLFLDKLLLVKRGGHADQLSRSYWGMDRFRIRALEKALTVGVLDRRQRLQAIGELARKCRIYAAGCRKRGREREATWYESLPSRYAEGTD